MKNQSYRLSRIGKLAGQLDMEIIRALKNGDYKYMDQAPAEKFLLLLTERRDRAPWRPIIHKYVQWLGEAYPHSKYIKKEQGVEILQVKKGEENAGIETPVGPEQLPDETVPAVCTPS